MLRPVLTLLTGTTAAQVLVFAARPVLTRLYTESEFGLLTVLIGWAAVLSTAAAGRYEDALMLPEHDEDAGNLFVLAGLLAACAALASGALWFGRAEIAAFFREASLAAWVLFLPPAVLLMSWGRLAESWHTRRRRFRTVSAGRVGQSLITAPGQLGAGLLEMGAVGLVGGMLAGQLALTAVLGGRILRPDGRMLRETVSWARMRRLAWQYRRFALFSSPAALLKTTAARLPALLLPIFFGLDVLGFFGLGYGVLALPVGLIGGAVGQVFFVGAAEAHRTGALSALTGSVFRRLAGLGVFPTLALMLAGPDVFAVVFGEAWRTAGVYVQVLAPWIFLQYLTTPLTYLFDVLEEQRADFAFSVVLLAGQLGALLAGGWSGDPVLTMALFGATGAVLRVFHAGWLLRLGRVSLWEAAGALGRDGLRAVPFLVPVFAARAFGPAWLTLLAVLLSGLGYLALFLRQNGPLGPAGPNEPRSTD